MDELSRRNVLRGLGGFALTGGVGCSKEPIAAEKIGETREALGRCDASAIAAVPNYAIPITGIQAYAQKSVAAGSTIDFHISSDRPYTLSVARLGWDTDSPSRDWVLHSFPQAPAAAQVIRPGSYVHVESALPSAAQYAQMTLECWVRPFGVGWQGLVSQHTYSSSCGFGLFLGDDGRPYLYFGEGGAFNAAWLLAAPSPLTTLQWHHMVAVFDEGTAYLYVDGELAATAGGFPAYVTPGTAPLRLGAYGENDATAHFLDGDLAMPVIYNRALGADEIATRASTLPPVAPNDPTMFACWPLDEEIGQSVADVSGCGRTGTIVNRGTWMIGGPGFDASATPRFGYDPDTDSTRGHALRFSSTDLYDCGWPISCSYDIPSDMLPGIYVGRIVNSADTLYDVTFVVRRADAIRPPAPILVLCPTNTWHAYNAPLKHSGFSTPSFYTAHPAGQPTYFTGIEMPWNNIALEGSAGANPYEQYPEGNPSDYSHLVRATRFAQVWLEQNGYDHDCIGDLDLHQNPSVLSAYRVVFIAGHSEYWTREAWAAVRDYLAAGGQVIVASGNTMFWRVSFDGQTLECRKLPTTTNGDVNGSEGEWWGEVFHVSDHERGGLMREAGYPAWRVIGLECVGYDGPHVAYSVTNPTHPFFQSPEPIAVDVGSAIGTPFGVGHEWDVRLQQIPGGFTPPIPSDYTPVSLAEGRSDQHRFDYQANWIDGTNQVISEIIDWVQPEGGRVFAAGSIAASQALTTDPQLAALFRNALSHMGVVFRLGAMGIGEDGRFEYKYFDGESWGPSFTTWEDHGGAFGGNPPAGVQWGPDSLAMAAITPQGSFLYKYWVGDAWSGWNDFGGSFRGRPAMVAWGRNRLDLFARGTDNHLYHKFWDGSAWSPWLDLDVFFFGPAAASDPAAVSREGNRLSVAVLAPFGNVVFNEATAEVWSGWSDLGGAFAYAPTLHFWGGKRLNVFAVDANGAAYSKHSDGSNWYPWDNIGGILASRVHVGTWGKDQFTLFAIGQDGRLKNKWWDGASWGPSPTDWGDLGGSFVGEPAVASYRGGFLSVLLTGTDGHVYQIVWDGFAWSGFQDMGGSMHASPGVFRWIST